MSVTPPRCRLYLITPPALEPYAFARQLEEALDAGDIAALQLRLKDTSDDVIARVVERLMPLTAAHDCAFILNDRPDLAARLGCDGVHVGQEDATYAEARRAMGPDRTVGVTCHHSRHLAMTAAEEGADYVAFGAFFPTTTKVPKTRAEPELIRWWADLMEVPCVAIGGITAANCRDLVTAGADFLAVSSGIWAHEEGPGAAVRAFEAAMAEATR